MTNFDVTDGNYTKRKNVFRLSSAHYPAQCDNECELLLQTQSQQDMTDWMKCLKAISRSEVELSEVSSEIFHWIIVVKHFFRNPERTVRKRQSLSEWQLWNLCKLPRSLVVMKTPRRCPQKPIASITLARDRHRDSPQSPRAGKHPRTS